MPRWGGIEHRREILERPPRARIAARSGKQPPARCGELHSGTEPLTPTVGVGEALTRDGPRSSRHASEAAGGLMMRLAELEAARQQREEALTAFSETTPVVAARPWGVINNDGTTEQRDNPSRGRTAMWRYQQ